MFSILGWGSHPRSTITKGLVSYWPLDEESGTRYDVHGSVNLTDFNTAGYVAGKQGNAADFVDSNGEYLQNKDSGVDLGLDGTDFTIAGWIKIDTANNDPNTNWTLVGIGDGVSTPGAEAVINVIYENHASSLQVSGSIYDDTNTAWVTAVSSDVCVHDTWAFLLLEYSNATKVLSVSKDLGTPGTNTGGAGCAITRTYDSVGINNQSSALSTAGVNDCSIDEVGVWTRILTDQEKTWLYNSGSGREYWEMKPQNLVRGLVSWWPLNEESGTRYDAHGSYDLSDINTCLYAAGKHGNAVDFEQDNSERLERPSHDAGLVPSGSMTCCCWVKLETVDSTGQIMGKQSGADGDWSWGLQSNNAAAMRFVGSADGLTANLSVAISGTTASAGVWYFLAAGYDHENSEVWIRVDNGTKYTTALTGPLYNNTGVAFAIGDREAGTNEIDGLVDEAAIWHRTLSDDEISYLYRQGLGRSYDELQPTFWEYASLSAAESSGDAWKDGDDVWITGGARFKYYDELATDGYSGLIHAEPYGGGQGAMSASPSQELSHAGNTDPDTWGWTDLGIGVKGTDYDYDTNGGKTRHRQITTSGAADLRGSGVVTADSSWTETFLIMDDLTGTGVGGGVHSQIQTWAHDASSQYMISLRDFNTPNNWRVNHTNTSTYADTSQDPASASRVWLYLTADKWAVWFDGAAAPDATGTTPRSFASGSNSASILMGTASSSLSATCEHGIFKYGTMTTS